MIKECDECGSEMTLNQEMGVWHCSACGAEVSSDEDDDEVDNGE